MEKDVGFEKVDSPGVHGAFVMRQWQAVESND
jgi:hypothetical protein